ncbi:pseudouridine synthase [Diplodia corticola]|uniref:tRNA pseudouridine(55) synthase n=1 Tax=Diplodia corticola TaxID=236234 RepID=A0A1J9RST1_9PEZI|nr:pseudouridine synthase [Diplodia corticola]OJD30597.1 pseudouridine synthase [Diplodia corticola]
MSSTGKPQLLQGVLAIHKPIGISSAQVLRDVEEHFNPSALFRPLLDAERAAVAQEKSQKGSQYRRKRGPNRTQRVKLGHGGTLDPLATGVLIAGVGSGTKALGRYLGGCQKTYESAVLFGCAADTYDNTGKIMGRAPHAHVTREAVEKALDAFKGDIMQKPPVYSAIKFNGKKAYEIMREGGAPPKMEERPVTVYKLELVDWFEPGTHSWRYPKEEMEATKEEKEAALKASAPNAKAEDAAAAATAAGEKRKRDEGGDSAEEIPEKKTKTEVGAEQPADATTVDETKDASAKAPTEEESAATLSEDGANAPAALIRMTVSSGFYVRTLCHDLGAAVGSLACMTSLVRTEQGDFELGKNVLEYEDLQAGEDVWGPKVKTLLEEWTARQQKEQKAEQPAQARPKSPEKRERSNSPVKTMKEAKEDDVPEMD